MKRPAFQFYPGDFFRDPGVRAISFAARGLWTDMLCLMHESDRRGYLQLNGKPVTAEQLARMTGGSTDEVSRLLQELENSGVFSRSEHGVAYSRRMVRDEQKRVLCAEAGKRGGGNPTFKGHPKGVPKGRRKGAPNPSSSSSTSASALETSNEVSCGEPADKLEPTMIFPCVGDGPKVWPLYENKISEWQESYPGIEVLMECRKALQWLRDNPQRSKTYKGMPAYLSRWLSRAQDSPRHADRQPGLPSLASRIPTDEDLAAYTPF